MEWRFPLTLFFRPCRTRNYLGGEFLPFAFTVLGSVVRDDDRVVAEPVEVMSLIVAAFPFRISPPAILTASSLRYSLNGLASWFFHASQSAFSLAAIFASTAVSAAAACTNAGSVINSMATPDRNTFFISLVFLLGFL
jgi:hypothetical protein